MVMNKPEHISEFLISFKLPITQFQKLRYLIVIDHAVADFLTFESLNLIWVEGMKILISQRNWLESL